MEITKTNESTNVEAKVKIGNINYNLNYIIKEGKINSINCSAYIGDAVKGFFNAYTGGIANASNHSFNFNSDIELAIKLTIITDVSAILASLTV